jgi:hypothetical protein
MNSQDPYWKKQYELLSVWQYQEANRFWLRFQISLALNGGLLIAYSALIGEYSSNNTQSLVNIIGPLLISMVGIPLSIIWSKITDAGALWQDYWVSKGVEIEQKFAQEFEVKIYSDIRNYEKKAPVRYLRRWIPRIFLITWSLLTGISILVIVYTLKIVQLLQI